MTPAPTTAILCTGWLLKAISSFRVSRSLWHRGTGRSRGAGARIPSHCPLDHGSRRDESSLSFELSQQYIDQGQPRVGTEDAVVGQIAAHGDEVRTVNRITIGRASYRWSPAWTATLALPYLDRTHEHLVVR